MAEHSSFTLLVSWSDGRKETFEIPPTGMMTIGPDDGEVNGPYPLYAPDGARLEAVLLVLGPEVPTTLVAPAPVGPVNVAGERLSPNEVIVNDGYGAFPLPVEPASTRGDSDTSAAVDAVDAPTVDAVDAEPEAKTEPEHEPSPVWLSEIMDEQAQRFDLRTIEGNEGAMRDAAGMSDEFGLMCRSCGALARGYRASASALADDRDGDEAGSARHHEAASRHFREAVELALKAEAMGV